MLKRATQLRFGSQSLRRRNESDFGDNGRQMSVPVEFGTVLDPLSLGRSREYAIAASIHKLEMRLTWDSGVDVDVSAALYSEDLKVQDVVWFKKLESSCGSVVHSGDMRSGEGSGDEEIILVDTAVVPFHVHHIVFTVSVYNKESVTLASVTGAHAWLVNGMRHNDDEFLCSFPLEEMTGNAGVMGLMTRQGAQWKFKALMIPTTGRTIETLIEGPEIRSCLRESPSMAPPLRQVHVQVLEAADLAAMETRRITKHESADPYFVMRFKDKHQKSRHVRHTLAPQWSSSPFDLGVMAETEPSPLRIEIFHHSTLHEDKSMGCVSIPGKVLYRAEVGVKHNVWFALGPCKDQPTENQTAQGKIRLEIEVSHVPNAAS